ncbi:MAG: hypothetical protein HFE39_08565 [Clostridiales bacterium]|nr:hypothetical protein [Clostridiales bacterium]
MLNPNIQLFAEPADPAPAEPTATNPSNAPTMYTEDYVGTLRGESARYRTRAKSAENALRAVLGLKDGDDFGDMNTRISAYQQKLAQEKAAAVGKANQRLIAAELKSFEGFDHKLLAKVIDLSNVSVDEDDNVVGLKEAVEAAEKEFPAVRMKNARYAPTNPPAGSAPALTKEQFKKLSYMEQYDFKQRRPEAYQKFIGGM